LSRPTADMAAGPPTWRTRRNRFKEAIQADLHPLAMWITIPWPPIMEIVGENGLDAAVIDLEHASFGLEMAEHLIVSAQLGRVSAIVRPVSSSAEEVGKILDCGADGIWFPMVSNAAEAKAAWKAVRYAPEGTRGWGGSHTRHALWSGTTAVRAMRPDASPYDQDVYSKEYVEKATRDIVTVFSLESPEAVRNVAEILDVGAPDLVSFGLGDFSVSVGFDPDTCRDAGLAVYNACKKRGIGMSLALGDVADRRFPHCFSMVGIDSLLLSGSLRAAVREGRNIVHRGG
jgi:4-hydroxy-2-oxoheptanedioate aldolase